MALFGKSRSNLAIAIDIGSRSIKGIVFEIPPQGQNPKAVKRIALQLAPSYDTMRIAGALKELLISLLKELGRIPAKVTVSFGTSLADCSLETWRVPLAEPRKSVSQKDLAAYFADLFRKSHDPTKARIVCPVQVLVNGYSMTPAAFREASKKTPGVATGLVRDIQFRVLVSSFSVEVGNLFTNIREMLGGVSLEFVPLAAAYSDTVVHRLNVSEAFMIDMGGTQTMMMLLKGGELVHCAAFPLGADHAVTDIAQTLSIPFAEAEDLKRQYTQGLLSEQMQVRIRDPLFRAAELWKQHFLECLSAFFPAGPLPGTVFLMGGGAYLPEIQLIIIGQDWIKDVSYVDSPQLSVLEGKAIFGGDSLGGFLQGPEDAGLGSTVWYATRHETPF